MESISTENVSTDNICIIGAGYAGIMAATRLERMHTPFTLLNKQSYHCFTTLLHEAAGGDDNPADFTVPLQRVLRQQSSAVVVDEVTAIDLAARRVVGRTQTYPFQWLVVALGWVPEYFGIPGLAQHSMTLTSLDAATNIRQHVESEFKAYLVDRQDQHLRIVVGGAGLTGIELLGELLEWLPKLALRYGIDADQVDVQNIEAMPGILPQVSPHLRSVAADVLRQKGAQLRTSTKIVEVSAGVVHVEAAAPIAAGTIIWTGGVRANPILQQAGLSVDRRGRAEVTPFLQSVDDDHLFIVGDCACATDEAGKPYPPTAQIASQMGKLAADNLCAVRAGRAMRPFHAHLKGTLASLGPETGVGDVAGIAVQGFVAGMFKEATKVKYLWDLGGFALAADKSGQVVRL